MKNYPDYKVQNISSIQELLRYSVIEHGTLNAFERINEKMTYMEFEDKVLRIAKTLVQYNGKYILLAIDDPIYFSVGYFAIIISGGIAVLGGTKGISNIEKEMPISLVLAKEDIDKYRSQMPLTYNDLPLTEVDGVCTILHSSGTASAPKGIMLSQTNICSNVKSGLEKYSMQKGDRFINLIPLYHAFGLVCDLLAPLLVGATICVLDDKNMFFSQMPLFKPTILNVPPVIVETLIKFIKLKGKIEYVTGGKLKKILCGGAGLSANISNELREYDIKAFGCYGLSECSPCVAVNRDDYYKDGSAGIILNCNKVTIAEDGEILIQGSNVMLGYYNDVELTNKVIINGVLHTGDLGYIDDDGFLYLTGRKSNLIVFSDGTKCSPEIYEKDIVDNTVAEEALVYTKEKNGVLKLNILVYIVTEQYQEEVKRYIQSMRTYHPFDRIDFTFEPLPKNATGKIRRKI